MLWPRSLTAVLRDSAWGFRVETPHPYQIHPRSSTIEPQARRRSHARPWIERHLLLSRLGGTSGVGRGDRVGGVLAGSLGTLTDELVNVKIVWRERANSLGRAVLEDTLVAGVASLDVELDALVVAKGRGSLDGSGGLRHDGGYGGVSERGLV